MCKCSFETLHLHYMYVYATFTLYVCVHIHENTYYITSHIGVGVGALALTASVPPQEDKGKLNVSMQAMAEGSATEGQYPSQAVQVRTPAPSGPRVCT